MLFFMGSIVNRQQEQIEKTLRQLMDEGYQNEELLAAFKKKSGRILFVIRSTPPYIGIRAKN